MSARDRHVAGQRPDWRYPPPLDLDARAYQRGFRRGWWAAAVFYMLGSVVLILAFHWLGVRP